MQNIYLRFFFVGPCRNYSILNFCSVSPSIHPWGSLAPFFLDLNKLGSTCPCSPLFQCWIARISSREIWREPGEREEAPCFPRWNSRKGRERKRVRFLLHNTCGLRVPRYRVIILYPNFRATFMKGGRGMLVRCHVHAPLCSLIKVYPPYSEQRL